MLMRIDDFRKRIINDMDCLVNELKFLTSRNTNAEEKAWRSSLPKVARAFSDPSFSNLQMFIGGQGNLSLEYRIPGANNWADIVLLGQHNKSPSAVIVELKDWDTRGDQPGPGEGLIYRHNRNDQHPSRQVGGYVEACRNFHSVVLDRNAKVHGCVLFTKDTYYHTYKLHPNDKLFEAYPCFGLDDENIKNQLPKYFANLISQPDEEFANDFVQGKYKQSRSFVSLVGEQILNRDNETFVLLDNQRFAFDLVNARVTEKVKQKTKKKRVILVIGPPGSGKSAVVARVWASLVTNLATQKGNIVIATTSTSQHTNWQHLVEKISKKRGSANVIIKAGSYTPLTTGVFGQYRKKYPSAFSDDANQWRDNMKMARSLVGEFKSGSEDNEFLVSLVDEAHALINPEHSDGRGQHGFVGALGPQAYQIIRASEVSVFLLDPRQGFRQQENTTVEDIRRWAVELGAEDPEVVSLEDCQFRCSGSKAYVDLLDHMLGASGVDATPPCKHDMQVTICDSPINLEKALIPLVSSGQTCRLLASYSRKWKTKNISFPHSLPPHMMDFCEPYIENNKTHFWSKIWNFAPESDYTFFVQAPIGSPMETNPLAEVGCPYVVRNFDFDYVGLLWFSDLVWRHDRWVVDLKNVHESGISRILKRASANPNSSAYNEVLDAVKSAYRILLSRAMKGVYIWCEDLETKMFLERFLIRKN